MISFPFFRRRNHKAEALEMEEKIEAERARIRQSVQIVASGSRVMSNMAGMLRLMALNSQVGGVDDD